MFFAKIFAIGLCVSGLLMAKAVVAPSASHTLQPVALLSDGAVPVIEPHAIMSAASLDLPVEAWAGH